MAMLRLCCTAVCLLLAVAGARSDGEAAKGSTPAKVAEEAYPYGEDGYFDDYSGYGLDSPSSG